MEKSLANQQFLNIDENFKIIKENVANAALKSGRDEKDISIMAVTKTVEPEYINYAINKGINLIGENRVQEFLSKKDDLNLDKCNAHLIGHLQTNKARQIVPYVSMIQSVDSIKIAKEISKQSKKNDLIMDILLEVNIGNEQSKIGFDSSQVLDACYEIAQLESVRIKGLMTIPPICDNNAKSQTFFSNMSKLFIDIRDKKIDNVYMDILSMGMSGDYTQAIMEGSNLIRIGSALFGARVYNWFLGGRRKWQAFLIR